MLVQAKDNFLASRDLSTPRSTMLDIFEDSEVLSKSLSRASEPRADDALSRGQSAEADERWLDACEAYEKCLTRSPSELPALLGLARCLYHASLLSQAPAQAPGRAYEVGIQALRHDALADETRPGLHFLLARIAALGHHWREVQDHAEVAANRLNRLPAWMLLAKATHHLGGETAALLQKAKAADPQSGKPWEFEAALAMERKDWESARRAVRQALRRERTVAALGMAAELALFRRHYKRALRHVDHALAQQPAAWHLVRLKGKIMVFLGRRAEAEACFRAVLQAIPDDPDSHYHLDRLHTV